MLGARSLALQEELKETQASLVGGHDFLKGLDEQIYASTKKRNAVYNRVVASVTGLAHDLRYEFVTADRQSIQHWAARFAAIQKGEG